MNTESQPDFSQKISELTNQYYSDNRKNTFFKTKQKMDCAATIAAAIGIDDLIAQTVFVIPNTNRVFLNYPLFKTFATPETYARIVSFILVCFEYCIEHYGNYSTHVNLDTFTISAAERYKSVVELFLQNCMNSNNDFSSRLTNMHIYYTPATFQNISKLLSAFIHPLVKEKIVLYDKKESPALMDAALLKN
jgi:hypothetical protein